MHFHRQILAIFLALLMLTGCAAPAEPTAAETTVPAETVGEEKAETLRIMVRRDGKVEDLETNLLTREYEQKTGIHVDWDIVRERDAYTSLNLALGAEMDLPDVFLNMGITNNQAVTYGMERKLLIDLRPYLEIYAPNFQKILEEDAEIRRAVTAPDGGIYTLPSIAQAYHVKYPQKAWIYRPWLEQLGLEVPENVLELEQVLTAFRDQDPNGNGQQDEIPMTGAVTGWMLSPVDYLMSAFICTDRDRRLNVDGEGTVTAPYASPRWREGLAYMHRLYEEKLLDPGALFQDQSQLQELTMGRSQNVVGVVTAGGMVGFLGQDPEAWKDWQALPPMADGEGFCVTAARPQSLDLGKFAVTTACENPEDAVRWIDWFYSPEGTMRGAFGVEGTDWRWAEPGELGLNGEQGTYVKLLPFGVRQNVHWNKIMPIYQSDSMRNGEVDLSGSGEQVLYQVTRELYEPHGAEHTLPMLFFQPEDVERITEISYLVDHYVTESYSKFILGEWDIENDAQWKTYLDTLESMGLNEMLEKYTEAFRAQYR